LVRRDHAFGRDMFSGRMGVAGDFAAKVVIGRRSSAFAKLRRDG
jgi:hypothetical protein